MKKHKTLTITTDFGDSFAVAQLHAVIDSLKFNGKIIENHSTSPFSINSGAFEILTLSKFLTKGSVNVGVIDPGVGSTRAGIIIKTKNFWFVGPDNGLLYPAAIADEIVKVWKITESAFLNVTNTFHGRDVFIKIGALLAKGKVPKDFKSTLINKSDLVSTKFEDGEVLHIDSYGNLKVHTKKSFTVGTTLMLKREKLNLRIPVVTIFNDVSKGQSLAYEGSSHTLEFAIREGDFAKEFNIKNNDLLEISEA